jgi:hypothetical protein
MYNDELDPDPGPVATAAGADADADAIGPFSKSLPDLKMSKKSNPMYTSENRL